MSTIKTNYILDADGTGAPTFTNGLKTDSIVATTALAIDTVTTGAVNIGTGASSKTITLGNVTGATSLVLNSGTGAINIGTSVAKTITIGNATGATGIVLNSGTAGVTFNTVAAGQFKVAATASPTVDMVNITNAGFSTTTAGVGALQITYEGGPAAIEASAARIDLTPGAASGGTWNGIRLVPTTAASGVILNLIKADNFTAGAGTETVLYVGTGYDNIINYNGTTVINGTGNVIAGQLSGTIPSTVLSNSTVYIGSTAIALNRATGSQTLTGVSIDGNAATASAVAANSVALGTDTTGNYVATVAAGTPGAETSSSGLTISAAAGEGTAATIAHADTSTLTGAQGTAGIAAFTLDGYGHVTAVTTATYLTAEADTLTTVTGRGASTSTQVVLNGGVTTTTTTALTLDSGTTGAINIGTSANAKTLTLGNVTGATGIALNSGTGNIVLTATTGSVQLVATGANIITATTNGTERMRVGSDGQVSFYGLGDLYGSAIKILASTNVTSERASMIFGDWEIGQDASGNGTKDFYIYGGTVPSSKIIISTTGAITIDGGITTTTTTALTLDSGTTGAINIGTNANAKTITIGNGTGATSLVLNAGTGAINIGTNAFARTITVGNATGASALTLDSGTGAINIGTSIAKTITIGNATGATALALNSGTGNIVLTATTGSVQLVATGSNVITATTNGAERFRITGAGNIVIGNGETSATPSNGVLEGTDGSGTNITGATLTIQGGRGTGTGAGGPIIFSTSAAGSTGAVLNAANERMRVDSTGVTVTPTVAGQFKVASTVIPTVDMVNITNTGFANVTAGVSALQVTYVGGAAAVEASAARIDLTPGATASGTWNGLRLVPSVAAATSVTVNLIKADAITAGAGTDNVLLVGTGYDNILNYNGTTVINGTGNVIAGQLSGTIPSAVLGNSTVYVGSTAIALNRATGTQTLTGVSIDGNAGTVTNGALTTGTLAQFAATTSLQLAGVISDEQGSGALVFATSPTFTTSIDSGATFGAFASSTALTLGYTGTAASTTNISTGATAALATKTVNLGTGGAATAVVNINVGAAVGGTTTIASPNITISGLADTATAATHYYVETTGGNILPKTLANVKTEIVTTAAVNAAAATTVGTVTSGIWNAGAVSSTGDFISTAAWGATTGGGQLYLNGATGNRIDFNANGVAAPAFTTRSAGTKVVYFPALTASAVDYAVGIEGSTLWHSVPTAAATTYFKWYGGTTVAATLTSAGTFTATADVCAYSDVRLKDNIEVIADPLDKVLKLRGVTFTRKDLDDNRTHMGVIAQEVEEVIPEVVITGDDGIKTVAYGNMVGLLIEAVKELTNQNKELLARIEQLEKK